MTAKKQYKFDAKIIKQPGMDAAYVEFPYDVESEFGGKRRVKIKATFDGVDYRGSLVNMGHGCHILGLVKDIRKKINKDGGDIVSVVLEEDTEKREVVLPGELKELFAKDEKLKESFYKYSYTNQKEFALFISSAKRPETKEKRLKELVEKLKLK